MSKKKSKTSATPETESRHAVMDLVGATCTSCAIAIEHLARRMDAVLDVYVDRGTRTIHVSYTNAEVLAKISQFVANLGYQATVKELDSKEDFYP